MIWLGAHKQVDRHFAGLGTPAHDKKMFQHLNGCHRCRERYRTYATLEQLAPGGDEQARERLSRGIFTSAFSPRQRTLVALGLSVSAASLVGLLTVRPPAQRTPDEFQARGSNAGGAVNGAISGGQPSLAIFRVAADSATRSQRAGSSMHAREPLAFSFTNPPGAGYENLMVFGVDDRKRVYWFWPAWTDPADDPSSIVISPGTEPMELGESVRHQLTAGRITIHGLFSVKPHHVREVEAAVAGGPARLTALGGYLWTETLEVTP